MASKYRKLYSEEIKQLISQGCSSENWSQIFVDCDFVTTSISDTRFSGKVCLGLFSKEFVLAGGIVRKAGLNNVTLHNCIVEDNVFIENVQNYIANYHIAEGCFIQNINVIYTEGESTFGNGTKVSVLNETGGREVVIYDKLSSHLAYIMAMYKNSSALIEKLKSLVASYSRTVSSKMGYIGDNATIVNCDTIRNVRIGEHSTLHGVSRLDEGTINSNSQHPVEIGHNVIASNFIISSGARVTDGVVLQRCFIGQACHLSHLFSAHDSLFFSNCQAENGESCAVFAGPYTVTMHKSSLLIAGMYSFLNAGSGSNQSNHMYKLGPIHQGVVERGSKTTSDSYILWPAKIGAFSLIMGRHVGHPDTLQLPFSYLIESNNKTLLIPGVNIKSVGTIRDAQKWPKRDNRKDSELLDQINFNLLSPYTIQKMVAAIDILQSLQSEYGANTEVYTYNNTQIKRGSLLRGIDLYTKAINKFLGNSIIKRLEGCDFKNDGEIAARLKPENSVGRGDWVDLSGLIIPKSEVDWLLQNIESGAIDKLEDIENFFCSTHQSYYEMEWSWAYVLMQKWYNININNIVSNDIIEIVNYWKSAVVDLDNMLYEDARKEFALTSLTDSCMDGDLKHTNRDATQLDNEFENNSFVKMVKDHIAIKTILGDELKCRLLNIDTNN